MEIPIERCWIQWDAELFWSPDTHFPTISLLISASF
jgi:hypothetical protein